MHKSKLLIISYSYPPANVPAAQRPYAIAKYINKEKLEVTVLTCANPDSSLGFDNNFNPSLPQVDLFKIKALNVKKNRNNIQSKNNKTKSKGSLQIKTWLFKYLSYLVFPDKGIFWYPKALAFLRRDKKWVSQFDYLITTSPSLTNHLLGLYIKKTNKKIIWNADFRDFAYVNHWEEKKGLKSLLYRKLEQRIIKKADKITFVTKTMLEIYQSYYKGYQAKMKCIYNGFEPVLFKMELQTLEPAINKISFFYSGSFYEGVRNPKPLLSLIDAALENKVLDVDDIEIIIAGYVTDELKKEMKRFKCYGSIKFLGSIPRSEVLKHMQQVTFLWLIVANLKSHYQTVPLKLFEYIATRKPIINFAPEISEASRIIGDFNLGYNFDTINFDQNNAYSQFEQLVIDSRNNKTKSCLSLINTFEWQNQISNLQSNLLNE